MKKLSYIIGCLFLMLFVWVSCDSEDNRMQTTGYLELGVSKNVEVVTRGFDVKDQSLAVDICTGANDSVVKHFPITMIWPASVCCWMSGLIR